MKLSQTLLPVLTAFSLALTPECTQKPQEKPELTERDRKLCDLAVKYARAALDTAHPVRRPLEYAQKGTEQRRELDETIESEKELILSSEILERNCDDSFLVKGSREANDETIAQIKDKVKKMSDALENKWY